MALGRPRFKKMMPLNGFRGRRPEDCLFWSDFSVFLCYIIYIRAHHNAQFACLRLATWPVLSCPVLLITLHYLTGLMILPFSRMTCWCIFVFGHSF